MPNPFKMIRDQIIDLDSFSSTHLLRYNEDPQFKTFTGGLCTLSVIICVFLQLTTMSLQTINKEHIEWSEDITKDSTPTNMTMEIGENNFMFGIGIREISLNDPKRYFNFEVVLIYEDRNGNVHNEAPIQMEACTEQNWSATQETKYAFTELYGDSWLCPKKGQTFNLAGKSSTRKYSRIQVMIFDCFQGAIENTTCATSTQLTDLFTQQKQLTLGIYILNTIINPNNPQAVSYYIEDSNYVVFNQALGGTGVLQLAQFEVNTDQSLWPVSQDKIEKGVLIKEAARLYPRTVSTGTTYSNFKINKSPSTFKYTRTFRKIDFLISYAGGLIGAIIGLIFIMNYYTKISYELCLGSRLFTDSNNEKIQSNKFNIFRFIKYGIYYGFNKIGCTLTSWKGTKIYDETKVEIQRQLDVKFILEKLIFMEKGLEILLGAVRFKGLHLMGKENLKDARFYRELFYLKNKFKKKNEEEDVKNSSEKKIEEQILKQQNSKIPKTSTNFLCQQKKIHPVEIQDVQKQIKEKNEKQASVLMRQNNRQLSQIQSMSCPQSYESELNNQAIEIILQIKLQSQSGNLLSRSVWERIDQNVKEAVGCSGEVRDGIQEQNNQYLRKEINQERD